MSLVSDPLNQTYLSSLKLSKGHRRVTQGTRACIGKEIKTAVYLYQHPLNPLMVLMNQ